MPRYLIERDFGEVDEETVTGATARSRLVLERDFPSVTWEHSHIVTDEDGTMKTFCVYEAPSLEMIMEHSNAMGDHRVANIFEIGGDVTPGDFPI